MMVLRKKRKGEGGDDHAPPRAVNTLTWRALTWFGLRRDVTGSRSGSKILEFFGFSLPCMLHLNFICWNLFCQ